LNSINPLDYRICFAQPLRLDDTSAWIEHVPFGMFMIDLLRPNVLVAVRGRNRGIREARGRYVAFQDSDDVAEPPALPEDAYVRIRDSIRELAGNHGRTTQ
jgi:Glycosyl transferase family 2